ncbi:MAG: type II secretion system F family protein [Candidatus Dojkabacteria bacterium]
MRQSVKQALRRAKIILYTDPFSGKNEEEYFFESMAVMIASGMPIPQVLSSLRAEIKSLPLKIRIDQMREDIALGSPLWKALQSSKLLPERLVTIVRAGEESGQLAENLEIATSQKDNEKKFKAEFRSAMLYPLLILAVMTVVAIGLIVFVLPNLSEVYRRLDVELPLATQILLDIGDYFGDYGARVIPGIFFAQMALYYVLFVNKKTRKAGQFLLYSIPITRDVIQKVEVGRFTYILGTMLKGNLPIDESLKSISGSTNFYVFRDFYTYLHERIKAGETFSDAFSGYKGIDRILPVSIRQMIISAEQSGNLPEIIMRVSEIYEQRTRLSIKNLTTLLEPVLLIVIWVAVAFFAISIALPIYSLVGNFQSVGAR